MPVSLEEAVAAAARRYPGNQWSYLDIAEQTRAIYREMHRLDLEQSRLGGGATAQDC